MACKLLDDIFAGAAKKTGAPNSVGVNSVVHAFDAARVGKRQSETVGGAGQLQYSPPHILSTRPPFALAPAAFNGVVSASVTVVSPGGRKSSGQEEVTVHIAEALPGSHVISFITKPGSSFSLNGSFTPTGCSSVDPVAQGFVTGFVSSFPVSMFFTAD
jgi:hypothetical protein